MLTKTQQKVYNFIRCFISDHHYAPTAAEIAEGIGVQSRAMAHRYVKALAESGLLELIPGKRRNIRLLATGFEGDIPLLGRIAAGQPIEALSQPETLDLDKLLGGKGGERYALTVRGDSMIDEGIFDGDIVICERRQVARSGEIVVALIDNENATLKYYQPGANGAVHLVPANPTLKAQVYPEERVQIQGVFVGLLRLPG